MEESIKMDRSAWLKLLNNNIVSQVISNSQKFLFAGNIVGDIFVLNINDLETTDKPYSKLKVYNQGDGVEINSLCHYNKFLVVGAIGYIFGLEWNEERQTLSKTRAWEIKIPMQKDAIEVPDVNSMWLCKDRDMLFTGCGDNNIYQFDLEDGRLVRSFTGHTDYIHGCVGDGNGSIYSASEDGTVKIWNERERKCVSTLNLNNQNEHIRPELGSFVGAVAIKDDWLVCGGGVKLSMWHLSSLRCAETFEFPGCVHVCDFVEGEIVVGGEHKSVQVYSFNGELLADVPVDHTGVYSIAWQLDPVKFMSIGGYDNKLHIMKQFRFLDTKIPLYGNTLGEEEEAFDEVIEDDENTDHENKRAKRF